MARLDASLSGWRAGDDQLWRRRQLLQVTAAIISNFSMSCIAGGATETPCTLVAWQPLQDSRVGTSHHRNGGRATALLTGA